ncbi:MAG TPA: sigma-70 family RNA polymerase sigma factor [Burkholderiales bacterium]|nr:sigma-70 family RNA polymerase sigma factor [Burkholderiales bacterium]
MAARRGLILAVPIKGDPISLRRGEFEQAVRAYSADLYRFAYWLCRDRHAAEDLVQEACLRAWKSWGDLRELAQAKAWLIAIVRNEYARSLSRKRSDASLDDIDEGQLPSMPSFEGGLEAAQFVAMLPLTYREPLLLQVIGGFSCAEIAGILGTSEGAVMTRLTRARQALRQQYTESMQRRTAK